MLTPRFHNLEGELMSPHDLQTDLQLIVLDSGRVGQDASRAMCSFDLSICRVWFDGRTLAVHDMLGLINMQATLSSTVSTLVSCYGIDDRPILAVW